MAEERRPKRRFGSLSEDEVADIWDEMREEGML
jgi:hypothetical protein